MFANCRSWVLSLWGFIILLLLLLFTFENARQQHVDTENVGSVGRHKEGKKCPFGE